MKNTLFVLTVLINGVLFSQNDIKERNWYDIDIVSYTHCTIDTTNQTIIVPLNFCIEEIQHRNQFKEDFFSENFPNEKWKHRDSTNYKCINLGEVVLTYDSSANRFSRIVNVRDSLTILKNVDSTLLRKQYHEIITSGKYSNVDCNEKEFKEAYLLFQKISFMTLIHSTFTETEYLKMNRFITPCMGPEDGEDYLFFLFLVIY